MRWEGYENSGHNEAKMYSYPHRHSENKKVSRRVLLSTSNFSLSVRRSFPPASNENAAFRYKYGAPIQFLTCSREGESCRRSGAEPAVDRFSVEMKFLTEASRDKLRCKIPTRGFAHQRRILSQSQRTQGPCRRFRLAYNPSNSACVST